MTRYTDFYRQSIDQPDAFWAEQARLIEWHKPFDRVCNYDNPPFVNWYEGGLTNLCHNAVDRHLKDRATQAALIAVSSETGLEKTYTFTDLHAEVQRMAASLKALGVEKGDRVLIYMPMIAEAAFAMLACARIGAIHCVVFGGFASGSLASRIEDAAPKVIVSADAGHFFILGRTDDVINVAGHRLGTREIEESIYGHAQVAEVAVVGVADGLKGQVAMAFVVLKDSSVMGDSAACAKLEAEIMKRVDGDLGAVARPARVRFVTALPKTRSGKLLRRVIQAVCEGRDAGDLTSMDDPGALQQIRDRMDAV